MNLLPENIQAGVTVNITLDPQSLALLGLTILIVVVLILLAMKVLK